MNITKTLCLCAALSGAAGVQAMENREFVTQQDNTRVNNYQTNRPETSKRLFVSQEVERQIDHIKQLLTNAKLAWMFENCFPNTLDTTVPPPSLYHPSRSSHAPAPRILYRTWIGDLFLILYMFQCHSPKSSPLPLF